MAAPQNSNYTEKTLKMYFRAQPWVFREVYAFLNCTLSKLLVRLVVVQGVKCANEKRNARFISFISRL